MPISITDLRRQLSAIEPDEGTFENIGPSEVDLLRELLDDEEPWLAARAVYALARTDAEGARALLLSAAESRWQGVRGALPAAAEGLPISVPGAILPALSDDSDGPRRQSR